MTGPERRLSATELDEIAHRFRGLSGTKAQLLGHIAALERDLAESREDLATAEVNVKAYRDAWTESRAQVAALQEAAEIIVTAYRSNVRDDDRTIRGFEALEDALAATPAVEASQ